MIDKNKIENIYNKVVEYIRKEEASKGTATLVGISGKKLPVSVNINGSISNVRGASSKVAPDLSSLNIIAKLIERFPTKNLFDTINTKKLREYGGGNSSVHWAVINKMFSFCDSFDLHNSDTGVIPNIKGGDFTVIEIEGRITEIKVLRRQRNRVARDRCLVESGYKCYVCGFDFEKVYGDIGKGFLEVHHKHPISTYDEEHEIPQSELVALCSNCHSMVHHGERLLDVDELKDLYNQNKNNRDKC